MAITKKDRTKMREAKQWAAFMNDMASVMRKHGVENLVAIYGFNGELRNTYLPLGDHELPLYCHISDCINEYLKSKSIDSLNQNPTTND